jgi:hypothetical protein
MQPMVLLSTNAATPRNNQYVHPPTQIYAPPPYRVSNSSTSKEVVGKAAEVAAKAAMPVVATAEEVEASQCPPAHSWEVT